MADKLAPGCRHQYWHKEQLVYEWDQTLEDVNLYCKVLPCDSIA